MGLNPRGAQRSGNGGAVADAGPSGSRGALCEDIIPSAPRAQLMRPPRPDATKRNVTLRIGTYRRLRTYLDEMRDETGLRGRSLTFDDAVGALLAEHEIMMAAGREALEECLRERFLGRDGRGP